MRDWVLVTGASSGIGKATAIELSKCYNVILNGRDAERLNRTATECTAGTETKIWQYNVADVDNVGSAVADFIKTSGIVVSYFVHCAGVSRLLPIKMTKIGDVQDTFRTNVVAPFLLTQALSSRRVNGDALKSVVFISSNISGRGAKAMSIYGSSKAAVDGLMRGLAVELAPKVRVNSVLPGAVKTRMTEAIFGNEEVVDRMKAQYPLGLGQPQNIADVVAFLLSDKAAWITGQQITVDGGSAVNISG